MRILHHRCDTPCVPFGVTTRGAVRRAVSDGGPLRGSTIPSRRTRTRAACGGTHDGASRFAPCPWGGGLRSRCPAPPEVHRPRRLRARPESDEGACLAWRGAGATGRGRRAAGEARSTSAREARLRQAQRRSRSLLRPGGTPRAEARLPPTHSPVGHSRRTVPARPSDMPRKTGALVAPQSTRSVGACGGWRSDPLGHAGKPSLHRVPPGCSSPCAGDSLPGGCSDSSRRYHRTSINIG